jgi:hypothetical protein
MPVQVCNGQNGGYVTVYDEEHAKRKAMKNGSSNLSADERKLKGRLLNADECGT